MAKKPVKKAVEKKVVAPKAPAKKAPAKKISATKTVKPVVKSASVIEPKAVVESPSACCSQMSCCVCKRGGFCGFVKKLIVFFVIFALGFATAVYCPCGKHFMKHGPRMQEMFVNGCLDTAKIPNPEMAEKIKSADVNADNCITAEEFKAGREAARAEFRAEQPEMAAPAKPMRR